MREQLADFITQHEERVQAFGDAQELVRSRGDLLPGAVAGNGTAAALREVLSNRDSFSRIRTYSQSRVPMDPLLERQAQQLYRLYLAYQIEPALEESTNSLEARVREELTGFRCDLGNGPIGWDDAWKTFHHSEDVSVRREAWNKLMDLAGHLAPVLLELAAVRNRAAREQGFNDHFEIATTIRELDEAPVEDLLRGAAEHTHGPLLAIKDDLDKELATFFRTRRGFMGPWHYADPIGLIPQWDEEPDGPVRREAVTAAQAFLRHRDLTLPADSIRPDEVAPRSRQRDPWGLLVDVGRLMYGVAEELFRTHADESLPAELRRSPHPIMTWAIWHLLVDEITDTDVLEEALQIPPKEAAKIRGRFLERQRRQVLVTVHHGLASFLFERALYANPGQDLATLWWQLREEALQARTRGEIEHPAWAVASTALGPPASGLDRALGSIVAAQIREALPPSTPGTGPLRTKDASDYLKERVLRHASTRPWQELVRAATGSHLSSRSFVEAMAPTGF